MGNWNDIIAGCRRGDHASQNEAYRQTWRVVYPAVYNLLRNKEEAEDVMQESMIRGFAKLDELRDAERYVPWQKQIAIRSALNVLRGRKNFAATFNMAEVADDEECGAEPMQIDLKIVNARVNEMPDGYRVVLQLHLLEGIAHEEIGSMLGITASTSRSQYSRALNKLKRELQQEYEKQL